MIKTYTLPVIKVDNSEVVSGSEHIHHAILNCTEKPDVRQLIQDTTTDEDIALSALALSVREATTKEKASLETEKADMVAIDSRDLTAEIDSLTARIDDLEKKEIA